MHTNLQERYVSEETEEDIADFASYMFSVLENGISPDEHTDYGKQSVAWITMETFVNRCACLSGE